MEKLELKWDEMTHDVKEFYLSRACMNSRLASYDWDEFQEWEREYIRDAVRTTSQIVLAEA